MKAGMLLAIENLEVRDIPTPEPSAGELLVRVEVCTVCGTDIRVFHHGHKHIRFPRITGHELSGEIVAVGKGVSDYKVGQRVAVAPAIPCGKCYYCRRGMQSMCLHLEAIGYHYDGGFAEYTLIPEVAIRNGCVNLVPANLSYEEAALAEPCSCAINGQELSGVGLGDTVAIVGAGPLGCIHIQLARARGARKVLLVELSEARSEAARRIADPDVIIINPAQEDAAARVAEETEGRGADRVIVACSSGKAQEQALTMVARRGNVNFFGGLPVDQPYIKFDSNLLHYGEFYVVGTHGSAPYQNRLALDLLAAGQVKVKELVTHHIPLDSLREGLRIAEAGEGMKVAIVPGG